MENNNFFELIHNAELFNDATMTLFMKKFGLNVNISQILALSKLKEEGPQRPSYLAQSLGYTSGAITKLTNNLLREGYILREHQEDCSITFVILLLLLVLSFGLFGIIYYYLGKKIKAFYFKLRK